MPDFPIVDTHVHLWDPRKLRYPWLGELPTLNKPYLLDEYREATASLDVGQMVFLQCDCDWSQCLDEARWIAELAESESRLQAIVAAAPIEQGQACRGILESLKEIPLVRGVRRLLQVESQLDFCLQPDFLNGLQVLGELELSFDICLNHLQLANGVRMVEQMPQVSFILDHIGCPDIKGAMEEPWTTNISELASLPNVVCKISGMITVADHESWTREQLKPYVDHVIDCFGFDRVLFGGDWPVVTLAGSYKQWFEALLWALEGSTDEQLRKLFRDNARRVYRL